MTSSEKKIQRNKTNASETPQEHEEVVESESLALDESGKKIHLNQSQSKESFDAEFKQASFGSADLSEGDLKKQQENELKALLDRHAKQSNSGDQFGNAIEKQKRRAMLQDNHSPNVSKSPVAEYEYEYHTDRIFTVVVVGLVAVSLIGWAVYMSLREPEPATTFTSEAPQAEQLAAAETLFSPAETDALTEAGEMTPFADEPTAANADPVETANAPQAPAASQSQPVPAGEKPTQIEAPEKPAFTTASNTNQSANTAQSSSTAPAGQPSAPASNQESGIFAPDLISRTHLARGVRQFEPIGIYETTQISLEGRSSFRLFWFTHITNMAEQSVSHNWYYQNELAAKVDMNIGSSSWRASTNKLVAADTLGAWHVEAVDGNGQVLARQHFELVE